MGFFDRLGHGFMVALHSLAFGFHHFSVFWYMLFYGIVLIPLTIIDISRHFNVFGLGSFLGENFFSFVLQLVSLIFLVAIVRRVVFSFKKKKVEFWRAMSMDIKLWVALGLLVVANMCFNHAVDYAQDHHIDNLQRMLELARLAWAICTMFFVSVVTIEECGFLDGVGRSARYFGRVFLEVICAALMFFILILGAAAFIDMIFALEFRYVLFQSLSDFSEVIVHGRDFALLSPGLTLAALIQWFFYTGFAVALPSLYYMARHNKKSPF